MGKVLEEFPSNKVSDQMAKYYQSPRTGLTGRHVPGQTVEEALKWVVGTGVQFRGTKVWVKVGAVNEDSDMMVVFKNWTNETTPGLPVTSQTDGAWQWRVKTVKLNRAKVKLKGGKFPGATYSGNRNWTACVRLGAPLLHNMFKKIKDTH